MEEVSNILNDIRFNIKSLSSKTKSNLVLIMFYLFLLNVSYNLNDSLRKNIYDLLIIFITIILVLFNISFLKNFLSRFFFSPIFKYIYGDEELDNYDSRRLLR